MEIRPILAVVLAAGVWGICRAEASGAAEQDSAAAEAADESK